ncbi:MAG: DUF2460 domain-containing protein [Bryobacteraceae bacterium]|nr:DUF2460 domain-containing protein [Bryobacteraceae bacterium]
MAQFPKLTTGAVTQYPSSFRTEHPTRILRYVDGAEQRWAEAGKIQRSWTLNLSVVSEEELSAIEDFFVSQQGQFGSFSFVDPYSGATYSDCSFAGDVLHSVLFDENQAQTSIVIRTAA